MAAFELRESGLRQAVGAKVIPFRTTPVLVIQRLTDDADVHEVSEVFPVFARIRRLSRHHWDTPSFREICAEMGLDPDEGRPRFRPRFEEIAGELERWVGEVFSDGARLFSPRDEAKDAALDLLDLMRADQRPDPGLLRQLRRRWVRVDPGYMPRFGELDRLVNSDALLEA